MNADDASRIAQIALMAAMADGEISPDEQRELASIATRLGVPSATTALDQPEAARQGIGVLAASLSDADARRTAYEVALAVCSVDGAPNAPEQTFLSALHGALGLAPAATHEFEKQLRLLGSAPIAGALPAVGATTDAALDQRILQQAMLTGALELLPERLANVAILPLQLRLVYDVGQRYGQQLDANQVKDLAGTFGLGAAAQMVEGTVRKALGGIASGLLGGLIGGATGVAAGAAVTFAATYALGHAAKQYYAQGRKLSADDMRALFTRFQGEAQALLPQVQGQIQSLAQQVKLPDVLSQLRGAI
ncbi:MAG TPA: DUF533 domain-containing protein [Myxococcaceae bacterium]|nr:DUF533 domain-containing protein [Myxococcaceae bacterium]